MILALGEPGRPEALSVEDWAEIRRLHRAEGMPIKAIARVMGVSRNTVRAALARDGPPSPAYCRLVPFSLVRYSLAVGWCRLLPGVSLTSR